MKTVFVSNYFNHHQKPFSDVMFSVEGQEYNFISTSQMHEERRRLGYDMDGVPDYVLCSYKDKNSFEICKQLICEADAVIAGSAPEALLRARVRDGKLVFRCMERPMKQGFEVRFLPRIPVWHFRNPRRNPIYLLCASAYSAADFEKWRLFRGRAYKWGYFPETRHYSLPALLTNKDSSRLLWCGRFIEWKHPDTAVSLAARLRDAGYHFELDLIGAGEMEAEIRRQIAENNLESCVYIKGAMRPEQVRVHMEKSGVFILTSDFREGWGAVVNEAMNSGCAVVASHAAGSVPFLLKHKENGIVYESGNENALFCAVKALLDVPAEQHRLGTAAYHSITKLWNAQVAAQRFVCLAEKLSECDCCDLFTEGPCSPAEIVSNRWFSG